MTSAILPDWRLARPNVAAASSDTPTMDVTEPADHRRVVGTVSLCPSSVVDDAVAAAQAAFPAWRDLDAATRGDLLLRAVAAVDAQVDGLTELLSREVGKVVADARGEILGALGMLRSFVALVADVSADEDRTGFVGTGAASMVRVRHVPVGPVGVIGPWNTPVFLAFNGIAPSLAAGCTVIVKPAVEAPLALTALVRLLAGQLPAGVLSVVPGRGSTVGARLAAHPAVRGVMFTGGTQTGRSIQVAAAATIKKVALELGGNDAALVLDDAVIDDRMLAELVAGSFGMSGQICFNVKRIYVHKSRYEEFVAGFTRVASRLIVGDPQDGGVHLGPMTTRDGYENAQRLIAGARAMGATVTTVGTASESAEWEHGTYVLPTIVTDIARDAELVLDEQFAPIIPIVPVEDDDDAIAEANRTEFGLASSVWSADLARAESVARRIEAGNTYINVHRLGASVPLVPFGGVKQSGLGRTHGLYSLEHCTETHAIVAFRDAPTQLPGFSHWASLIEDGNG